MIYLALVIISLMVALTEAVSYLGYFRNNFGIHSFFIYLLAVAGSLLAGSYPKIINKVAKYLTLALSVSYFILIILENITYPNFVFTATHINPVTMEIFMTLAWFHYLAINKSGFLKSLLVALIVFISVGNAGKTLGFAYKGLKNIASDPFATYDQKMTKSYPGFYPAMQQVKSLTPENATVLIPPQGNPWEVEGNMAMVNYFLYPRSVANLNPDTISDLGDNTYILIAKGSWPRSGATDYGWPKVAIKAKRVWELDVSSGQNTHSATNYDPMVNRFDWGLIEVSNE